MAKPRKINANSAEGGQGRKLGKISIIRSGSVEFNSPLRAPMSTPTQDVNQTLLSVIEGRGEFGPKLKQTNKQTIPLFSVDLGRSGGGVGLCPCIPRDFNRILLSVI